MSATDHTAEAPACTSTGTTNAPVAAVGRFDKQAARYNRHAAIQRDMAAWLAQWLPAQNATGIDKPDSDTGSHALDLGAGEGTFTRYLVQRFAKVSALDSSLQMLIEGNRSLPQADWLHGDAWTLQPLSADALHRVSRITSASLLQWCRTPEQTLRHWAQRCQQGTRMLHGFYVEPTLSEWRSLFGGTGQLGWLDAQQWEHAFEQSGWRVLRSECEVRRYRFSNALELARSLHGTGAIAHAGQLGSGRFRTLLRAYDTAFSVSNLASAEPLYSFDNAAQQHAPNTTDGIFASWAFFRIEVERT